MVARLDVRRLGRAVADAQDAALRERARTRVADRLARIHAALGVAEVRRRRVPLGAAIPIAFAAVAVVAVLLWHRGDPLRFEVGGASTPGHAGLWVAAPFAGPTPIDFSDGTQILVAPGARARVVDVSASGAHVVVERGMISADVVPRKGNDWSVIGGPFEIHVTGTSFDATWDPEREELSVVMHRGRVSVRGPCLTGGRALAAGERATISCGAAPTASASRPPDSPPPTSAMNRSPDASDTSAAPEPSAAPRSPVPPPSPPAASPAASSTPTPAANASPSSWRDLARQGRYKDALTAAEDHGFTPLCDELAVADLMELAAAARLAGRSARATEAYSAVRRRFPGSDAAATAAFHLGQLAFDASHAFDAAHRFFLAYLAERPGGSLAAEALGRAMEAEQRMGDLASARATAERYLARFPTGAHAALANSLLAP